MSKKLSTERSDFRALASTFAGSWYPGTADGLDTTIQHHLANTPDSADASVPNVLILPHAGYSYAAGTAAYGLKRILKAPFKRVILLAPSHCMVMKNQMVAPGADGFSTPYGIIPIDHVAIETVARAFSVTHNDRIHTNEHSAQMQYPILQYALKDFSIVPFIVGEISRSALPQAAAALRQIIDSETLLVVSSDFTHYGRDFGYAPYGTDARSTVEAVDNEAAEKITRVDCEGFLNLLDTTGATICGRYPIAVLLSLLPPDARLAPLHYETSSDQDGDYSRFVCYMCMAGTVNWKSVETPKQTDEKDHLSAEEKRILLRLARTSIQHALEMGETLPPDYFDQDATPNLRQPMGCFVTLNLKANHALRGCIGEITARQPLYKAVTTLAVHSAFGDHRFPKLQKEELNAITIEISALTPERPVDDWKDIIIGKHGMTVSKHGHSAVFLPQVAPEQGWTLEETLTHLSLKAGLGHDAWRQGAQFTVFEALVFGETDFT